MKKNEKSSKLGNKLIRAGYAVGAIGTPIVFIVFILQLASSGGTFPIETAPSFSGLVP